MKGLYPISEGVMFFSTNGGNWDSSDDRTGGRHRFLKMYFLYCFLKIDLI